MSKTYSITDLAAEFAVTTRTIRFYEDQGLLNPTREGQRRIYQEQDRIRLILILRGKRLGFSLQESKELIELYDPSSGNLKQLNTLLKKIHERKAQLAEQLRDIQIMQDELEIAEKNLLNAMDNVRQK